MSNPGHRSPEACYPWQGLWSPPAMKTLIHSLLVQSVGSSTSSGVSTWRLHMSEYLLELWSCVLISVLHPPPSLCSHYFSSAPSGSHCIDLKCFRCLLPGILSLSPPIILSDAYFNFSFSLSLSHWCQREAALGEQTADLYTASHRGSREGKTVVCFSARAELYWQKLWQTFEMWLSRKKKIKILSKIGSNFAIVCFLFLFVTCPNMNQQSHLYYPCFK